MIKVQLAVTILLLLLLLLLLELCHYLDSSNFRSSYTETHREDMWHWLFDCLADAILLEYLHSLQFNFVAQLCSRDFLQGLFTPQPYALSNAQSRGGSPCGRQSSHWPLSHRTEDYTPHKHSMSCFAVFNSIYHHCFTKLQKPHSCKNQPFQMSYIWIFTKRDACTSQLQWQYAWLYTLLKVSHYKTNLWGFTDLDIEVFYWPLLSHLWVDHWGWHTNSIQCSCGIEPVIKTAC